ncbi:MAG: hypothetical protein LUD72_10690, partial [Bacteroidales bacterium]|nr:hypothetical protein [Bacteroidales bacterium]
VPQEMTAVEGSTYTQYTLSGSVGDDLAAYSNFKVVVLANWGAYPTVTAGTTTIDSLVEGDNTTFSADTFLGGVDESHLIPFYGVREYSDVEWKRGRRTTLSGDITLLRALAKVEVVLSEDSGIDGFDSVSIVRYNESGYCAPKGVYLRADYDHGYDWDEDFTSSPHLVGDANDSVASSRTYPFTRQDTTSAGDVWVIYLPEYDNTSNSNDYSFIRVTLDDINYEIYFSNYTDGSTSSTADYDIYRNHLYRFVTDLEDVVAEVESWEFSMEVKQYVTAIGTPSVYATFDAYYYDQNDADKTIEFPIMDVVSVFVMIPSLTYNGKDITAEADWVCTASNGASVIVTKNPTVSEGPVEIHVSSLTATTGYKHYLTLSATWTGDDGSEKGITYNLTVSVVNERPIRDTSDTYVEPTD